MAAAAAATTEVDLLPMALVGTFSAPVMDATGGASVSGARGAGDDDRLEPELPMVPTDSSLHSLQVLGLEFVKQA